MDIHQQLADLPVVRYLDDIPFDQKAFIIRAATGNGKTMVIPAMEALRQKAAGIKPRIVMRQPARMTCEAIKRSLVKFWSSFGLKVVARTSDDRDPPGLDEADIILVSDGSLLPLLQRLEPTAYYLDEAHDLPGPGVEIDLAEAKRRSLPIRLMSASIDAARFVDYLGGCPVLDMGGRVFPVRCHTRRGSEDLFVRSNKFTLWRHVDDILRPTAAAGKNTLVFLPTQELCEDFADLAHQRGIDSIFLHGGVDVAKAMDWVEARADRPWVAFATVAASTGITLDVHVVIIADDKVYGSVEKNRSKRWAGAIDSNGLIQMKGRAGRIQEGDAYLITESKRRPISPDESVWLSPIDGQPIKPEIPSLPCESNTPVDVYLAFAEKGLDPERMDILSTIDPNEMGEARTWLRRSGCIDTGGSITEFGRSVAMMSLDTYYAHLVLSAPSHAARLATLAAVCLNSRGTYQMLKQKPKQWLHDPVGPLLPPGCVVNGSAPATLANIMAASQRAEDMGTFDTWCRDNNLVPTVLSKALRDFRQSCNFSSDPAEALSMLSFDADELHAHLRQHILFKSVHMQEAKTPYGEFPHVFDTAVAAVSKLPFRYIGHGIPQEITAGNYKFNSLDLSFVGATNAI